jgi:hypothetical protein
MPDANLSPKEPCVGPWYWIYLRPCWRLFAAPAEHEEETLGHVEFWRQLATGVFARHYGLAPKKIAVAQDLCYAMPRGRCARRTPKRQTDRTWALYEGGDLPKGLRPAKERRLLLAKFGLRAEARDGNVEFVHDEHEVMQEDDQLRLQRIIGAVPY